MGTQFFVYRGIISAVKTVEYVSDRMSYIVLRGRWCNIIVLNVPAPSEEENDDTKDSFYEELEQVFHQFPKCKGKGKAVPLQAWTGPEGSRKLRFPDFVTTAQDGGRLSALHTGHIYTQEILLVLISVRG